MTPTAGESPAAAPGVLTDRLLLRRWRAGDREPFAALNSDPAVMRYFPELLDRTASDAVIDRIEAAFDRNGYGLWAVELRRTRAFLGFTGLSLATFEAPFTPAVEVGWRLARFAWGHGYATEAAAAALDLAFGTFGLDEVVSFTAQTNHRSEAVMIRLGMIRDVSGDFDHPAVPPGNALRRHVLYRLSAHDWRRSQDDGTAAFRC